MKTHKCPKCGITKSLDWFYKDSSHGTGYRRWCKECERKNNRSNREYYKNYYHLHAKKRILWAKEDYWKNHNKHIARKRLKYAVSAGNIKREPCVICGKTEVEGHHTDYSKPLQVIWLCTMHHRLADIGEIKV